jgi:hypothetical protein
MIASSKEEARGGGKIERNSGINPLEEMGSNTSTVALRIVGGDEKGTQFLGI